MTNNELLYNAEYYKVYNINTYSSYYSQANDYLSVEVHKLITDFYTDLIHFETPTVIIENNQEVFDALADSQMFYEKMYEVTRLSSINGEAFVQVYVDANQEVSLLIHRNADIISNSVNEQLEPEGYRFNHPILLGDKQAILQELHLKGRIEYSILFQDKQYPIPQSYRDTYAHDEAISDEYVLRINTGFENNLVIHFKNLFNTSLHGESDYSVSLEAKSKKLNELLNTTYSVIRQHSDPRAIIDSTVYEAIKMRLVEEAKNTDNGKLDSLSENKIIEIANQTRASKAEVGMILKQTKFISSNPMSAGKAFEYVTWDGKLEEAYKMIDKLESFIYEAVGLSKMIISPNSESANLSGVSYKRHVSPALRKAKKKQSMCQAGMIKLVSTIMEVLGYSNSNISIKFGDGLENDLMLMIETQQKLIDYKLTTYKQAIQNIFNMNAQQAEEYINEINQEQLLINPMI